MNLRLPDAFLVQCTGRPRNHLGGWNFNIMPCSMSCGMVDFI